MRARLSWYFWSPRRAPGAGVGLLVGLVLSVVGLVLSVAVGMLADVTTHTAAALIAAL